MSLCMRTFSCNCVLGFDWTASWPNALKIMFCSLIIISSAVVSMVWWLFSWRFHFGIPDKKATPVWPPFRYLFCFCTPSHEAPHRKILSNLYPSRSWPIHGFRSPCKQVVESQSSSLQPGTSCDWNPRHPGLWWLRPRELHPGLLIRMSSRKLDLLGTSIIFYSNQLTFLHILQSSECISSWTSLLVTLKSSEHSPCACAWGETIAQTASQRCGPALPYLPSRSRHPRWSPPKKTTNFQRKYGSKQPSSGVNSTESKLSSHLGGKFLDSFPNKTASKLRKAMARVLPVRYSFTTFTWLSLFLGLFINSTTLILKKCLKRSK